MYSMYNTKRGLSLVVKQLPNQTRAKAYLHVCELECHEHRKDCQISFYEFPDFMYLSKSTQYDVRPVRDVLSFFLTNLIDSYSSIDGDFHFDTNACVFLIECVSIIDSFCIFDVNVDGDRFHYCIYSAQNRIR